MKALVFFVFLCTLLLSTNKCSYADKHSDKVFANIKKTYYNNLIASQHYFTFLQFKNTAQDNSAELFLAEDIEGDDGNSLPKKKYKILNKSSSSLICLLIFNHLHNRVKASLLLCSHVSNKNPLQSVLRI